MTPWLWLGLAAGAALEYLLIASRRRAWQRREAYRAHVQAIATHDQLINAARNTRLDVVIERSRGSAS